MSNSYFQFKQFIIHQDKCAMKVCTDACLFGAWMANAINEDSIKTGLDIGGGTGLLSLMLSQKHPVQIDIIEINPEAANQAKDNIHLSSWKYNINIINESLQDFHPSKKYDFIFSNPPFFEEDLLSSSDAKNSAKHHSTLTLSELIQFAEVYLSNEGKLALLLPFHRVDYFENLIMRYGFYIEKKLLVKQTPSHSNFRAMYFLSRNKTDKIEESQLSIHNNHREYTPEFKTLLGEYYLTL